MTYYPSCITDFQICNFCYASESCLNCNDGNSWRQCSNYCNTGCNTICITAQTFCNLGVETVVDHADVTPKTLNGCWQKDEFIFRNWTASFWNTLIKSITDAAKLGVVQNQGTPPGATQAVADPCNNTHPANSLVTAEKYNQQVARINFFNKSLSTVIGAAQVGCENADVIRGTHAMALKNGYETMKFNKNVCDVCNVPEQNRNSCNCSCTCSCACQCGCDCDCDCDCGCSSGGRS